MIQADTYITACGTGRKETANKTTIFINHTADARRQMAGCVCVWTRQLWLSYLLDVDLPRCCLLGFTEGAIVGIAFLSLSTLCVCMCLSRCATVWGQTNTFMSVCFFYTQVSVPVHKCTCPVVPSSKRVNLTLCLKAVGEEGDKENLLEAEAALTCAFFSYQRAAKLKIKQRNDICYLLCIYPQGPTETKFVKQPQS